MITINLGDEFRAKVEKSEDDRKGSYFEKIYNKAENEAATILSTFQNAINNEDTEKGNYYNNIIAFSGERGSGKTSCMLSFAEKLENKYVESVNKDVIQQWNFFSLPPIDPSIFEAEHNIIDVVLANLLKKFENTAKNKKLEEDCERARLKKEIIELFNEVHTNLKTMNSSKKDILNGGGLDVLVKMGATTEIRANIIKLINKALEYINPEHKGRRALILKIDDLDLNTKHGNEMAEQIRKYFMIPNVIILIALKIDQLSTITVRQYLEEFEKMVNKRLMSKEELINMAEKYISKLIPVQRRFDMPELGLLNFKQEVKIVKKSGGDEEYDTIDQCVRSLIYDKTRMVFLNPKTHLNYIVPRNLRDLIHMVSFLKSMPTPDNIVKGIEEAEKQRDNFIKNNLLAFKNYFINVWIKNNFDGNYRNILLEFERKWIGEKNKYIVLALDAQFRKGKEEAEWMKEEEQGKSATEKKEQDERRREYFDIINKDNNSLNVSLGDALFVINYISNREINIREQRFFFAIKALYSFWLHETYKYTKENEEENDKKDEIRYSDYQKLVGGAFINKEDYDLMPKEKETGKRREHREISYSLISETINNLKENDKIKWILWFHFFIFDTNKDRPKSYRKNRNIFYEKGIDYTNINIVGKVQFDILGFFFYISNDIKKDISLLNSKYKIIKARDEKPVGIIDFFNKNESTENYPFSFEKEPSEHEEFYIGNIEVLEELNGMIRKFKYTKETASNRETVLELFNNMSELKIYTGFNEQSQKKTIDVKSNFIDFTKKVLREVDDETFNKIFAISDILQFTDVENEKSKNIKQNNVDFKIRKGTKNKETVIQNILSFIETNNEPKNKYSKLLKEIEKYSEEDITSKKDEIEKNVNAFFKG